MVYVPKRPGEPDGTFADSGKIRSKLGWKTMVTFEDGVARMMGDIEHWRDAPLWDPDSIAIATRTWFLKVGIFFFIALHVFVMHVTSADLTYEYRDCKTRNTRVVQMNELRASWRPSQLSQASLGRPSQSSARSRFFGEPGLDQRLIGHITLVGGNLDTLKKRHRQAQRN